MGLDKRVLKPKLRSHSGSMKEKSTKPRSPLFLSLGLLLGALLSKELLRRESWVMQGDTPVTLCSGMVSQALPIFRALWDSISAGEARPTRRVCAGVCMCPAVCPVGLKAGTWGVGLQ